MRYAPCGVRHATKSSQEPQPVVLYRVLTIEVWPQAFGPEGYLLSAQILAIDPASSSQLNRLPLVTLYLTERCNSRCVTCDYWRHGRADMNLDAVKRLLPSLGRLGTQVALLSGGEPLLNPEWPSIARALRDAGLKVWLLTSGLA